MHSSTKTCITCILRTDVNAVHTLPFRLTRFSQYLGALFSFVLTITSSLAN